MPAVPSIASAVLKKSVPRANAKIRASRAKSSATVRVSIQIRAKISAGLTHRATAIFLVQLSRIVSMANVRSPRARIRRNRFAR